MATLTDKVQTLQKALFHSPSGAEESINQEIKEAESPITTFARPSVGGSDSQIRPSTEVSTSLSAPAPRLVPEREELDDEEEEESSDPVPLGEPSIPVNHTTGAARLLLCGPIKELMAPIVEFSRIKNEKYPMVQEERRGLIRLFGRGEGMDLAPGYGQDPLTDHASENTPRDPYSDVSSPPGEEWGQLGGLTPPSNMQQREIGPDGMPDFDRAVVLDLVQSYLDHINIIHPILIPRRLYRLVEYFLKFIPDGTMEQQKAVAQFTQSSADSESPGAKRKRSPSPGEYIDMHNSWGFIPGHPFRSITTALVLLVLALGKICKHKGKIPDVISDRDFRESDSAYGSSPRLKNGYPTSPLRGYCSPPTWGPPSSLASPNKGEPIQPQNRRPSAEPATFGAETLPLRPRNLDVIPGLAYFALATDIIGNQIGGNSLQHVHVNILAGLYHGQLARVLESHAYIHQACRSLQVILRP